MKKTTKSAKLTKSFRKLIRRIKQVGQMEAVVALHLVAKYTHLQIKIRPRIRLFSRVTLLLVVLLVITGQIARYIKSKEPEIKVNGQVILVAEKVQEAPNAQIDSFIIVKKSPFELHKPVEGVISQRFIAYHRAIDIAAPFGSLIQPVGKGVVEFAGFEADGKGNVVIVDHGDGLKSLYAHMNRIDASVGNQVDTNMVIGTIGLTGRTTGPHVHLEIYDNGIMVDPAKVLPE